MLRCASWVSIESIGTLHGVQGHNLKQILWVIIKLLFSCSSLVLRGVLVELDWITGPTVAGRVFELLVCDLSAQSLQASGRSMRIQSVRV